MATSVYPAMGGNTNNTTAANFIPEIWSDEIIAAYKKGIGYCKPSKQDANAR